MPEALSDWPRPYYRKPGGRPFLFFVVYGTFGDFRALSVGKYRSEGVPEGLELARYDVQQRPDVLSRFQEGYLWEQVQAQNPHLAKRVVASPGCLILRGEFEDRDSLNYLRDTVGLLTFFLDQGGVTVYDPSMFQWWEPDEWRRCIFDPGAPVPSHHAVILTSEESPSGLTWFHTRGMRKFGRPDLSIRNVPAKLHEGVIDLCNRFIEFQAFGGVIEEGQEIRMRSLPEGMTCHHAGDVDDPDFNNVHVEITWQHERN
jgi:hypothetical protein